MSNVRALAPVDEQAPVIDIQTLHALVVDGDLSKLNQNQQIDYYRSVCEATGTDYRTRPFAFIRLNGKLVLYALRECAEQLRRNHRVSTEIIGREVIGDVYVVTAKAAMPDGRTDASTGAVAISGLKGEALANAYMKAECVPLDSEILTRDGFKSYSELQIGEEVLAYDTESDSTAWTPLLAVRTYTSSPVIRMQSAGGQFDAVCTPDHKWAVANQPYIARSEKPRGPYTNRSAARVLVETAAMSTAQRIILSGPERATTDGESLLTPVEAAILGWAVTDGTIKRVGNSVRIGVCQSKEDNFPAVRELVSAAAGEVKEFVSAPRTRTFPTGRTYETKEQHWWYIPAAISRAILERAGFHDKADLPAIVTRLSSSARKAMLQAFMMAEGDKRGVFANSSRGVLDAFTILCALEGIATGRETPKNGVSTIRQEKTRHVAPFFLKTSDAGKMDVWCPQTAYGTWVMRQNGRVMVTGNTKAKRRVTLSICGLGMLDESEAVDVPGAVRVAMNEHGAPAIERAGTGPLDPLGRKRAAEVYHQMIELRNYSESDIDAWMQHHGFVGIKDMPNMTEQQADAMKRDAIQRKRPWLPEPSADAEPSELIGDDFDAEEAGL